VSTPCSVKRWTMLPEKLSIKSAKLLGLGYPGGPASLFKTPLS